MYLSRSDFKYPDRLDFKAVQGLDKLTGILKSRPVVLSDWRAPDPESPNSQHQYGKAIDTTWPGTDPELVISEAEKLDLFGGLGLYVNEAGTVSFHFDSRAMKASGEPARWGGVITHPYDVALQEHVRRTEYVGIGIVAEMIKKKGLLILIALAGLSYLIYRNFSQ